MIQYERKITEQGLLMKIARGSIFSLKSAVDYQKNSIVSKEIIKREKGTITLFAFDKGQGLSEHIAPFDAFLYVVDGKAKIRIAQKIFYPAQGETIILPAGQPHAVEAVQKFKMLLVMIRA